MKRGSWLLSQGILLTVVAIMVSILSFFKETIFANYFGTTATSDAYAIAIQVPEVIFAFIWEAIATVFIPIYTDKLHNEGKAASKKFFSNILTIVCLISIVFIVLGEFLASAVVYLFAPGLSAETHALTVSLMRWIFPILFFEGIIRVLTGVSNVHDEFVAPRVLSCLRNIGIIVFIVLFVQKFGIYAAAFGFLTGMMIECFFVIIKTRKYADYSLTLDLKDDALKKAVAMALPLILGIGARELNHLADKIIASFFHAGSISSLNYASKLSSIIETTILSNVVFLLYPRYSALAASNQKKELVSVYEKTVNICMFICIPTILGIFFLRQELVSIAFERGAFNSDSVKIVSELFTIYIVSAMFTTINGASVKVFAACGDTKRASVNALIGVLVNIVLNIILSYFWGIYGLAIATLTASAVMCARLFILIKLKICQFSVIPLFINAIKYIFSGAIMYFVLRLVMKIYSNYANFGGFLQNIAYCLTAILIGALVYVFFVAILNFNKTNSMIKSIITKKE